MTSIIIVDPKGNKLTFCIESFDLYLSKKWTVVTCGGKKYLKRGNRKEGFYYNTFFHREFTGCPKGLQVDHKDGDGLNNSGINLRTVSPKENYQNRRKLVAKSSKYIGVQKGAKRSKGWRSGYRKDGKWVHLGYFSTEEEEAAAARDKAVSSHYKGIVRLNLSVLDSLDHL